MKEILQKIIQPHAARLISSNTVLKYKRQLHETKRKLCARPHGIELYLRINDPYSYLLVQVLADFEQRYGVHMTFKTILNLQQDMYPEAEMWHENGFYDATHLADLYQLKWPEKAPEKVTARIQYASQRLLELENNSKGSDRCDWAAVEQVFEQYWFQQPCSTSMEDPIINRQPADHQFDESLAGQKLLANEQALANQGHYMSAMLNYAGEWYWGLDRLDHLEKRLMQLGLGRDTDVQFDKTYSNFCKSEPLLIPNSNLKKLTLYFSIRSPYSHLGLQQAIKLAQHYQLVLEVKPVLPMVMRGLSVPDTKKMYIFHDTKREAEKLNIDYGFVADPLGEGVNRCYSLFKYAQALGKESDYLLNYAQAVNAQGIRSDTDAGLKIIVERSGLDWGHARQLLQYDNCDRQWQIWAEENRQEMIALGSWGVPTFHYGDVVLWGQDRAGVIERTVMQDLHKLVLNNQ
ncbi:MAG: DsbA family protein [Oleispira sp.]